MGQDTRLRAKTKDEYNAGAGIYEIIHPNTKVSEPTTLMPSSNLLKEQILEGDYSNVKSTKGYASNIINKIEYDLSYAKRVYLSFGIDPESKTATTQLQAALVNYETSNETRDDTELKNDMVKDTIQVLKRNGVTALEVQAAFVRTSTISGIITLELLAIYLGISITVDLSNLDLAELIKVEIELL